MTEKHYTVESYIPETSVGFLIKRCGALMSQVAERRFGSLPISFTQWIILIRLVELPQASASELSAYAGHDRGALTRVIDELQRSGLVRRERSRQDRRAVQIAITPEGRRLARDGKRVVVGLLNSLLEPYSKADVDALVSLLQRFLAQMEKPPRH
jgi:DNA-binding MarR family transcriptional regulator